MLQQTFSRIKLFLVSALIVLGLLMGFIFPSAQALILQNRLVNLSSNQVSATNVTHAFQFTVPSTNAIGSIVFEYCDNSPIIGATCNAPAGLDVDSANLISQTGNVGFAIHGPTTNANKIVLFRSPSAGLAVPSSYTFDNIINPSTANRTAYVRISSHITANGSGSITDNGSVAFATVSPFSVSSFVPPFLRLCVGITVTIDCSSISGDSLDLGILSSQTTKAGTSQFSAATNSLTGYVVSVLGTTMTSGSKIIPAMNPAGGSQTGVSQFGINLRANTAPSVGQDPQGAGTASPQSGYGTQNLFKFGAGDTIVTSTVPSEFNLMTVSHIVNVASSQPAGIYNTTLTYLGTAQF